MSKKILSILLSITMMLSIFSCIDFSAYAVEKFLFGDVTGDGTVDFINDITSINNYINGRISFTEEQKILADVNGDGIVDSTDVNLVNDVRLGTITQTDLPVYSKFIYCGYCGDNAKFIFYKNGELVIFGTGSFQSNWSSYEEKILKVNILEGITSVGVQAFYYCSSLTSVTIPNSVTSIGKGAFSYCTSLTNVTIPDSVTSIGISAFYNCTSLTSVIIPNSVTSIGSYAFSYVNNIEYHGSASGLPWGAKSVNGYVDGYLVYKDSTKKELLGCSSQATSVTIPNSVTSIGNYAFYNCKSLTSVTMPKGVTSIGDRAFRECNSLTSVTIPNNVTSIGSYAFYHCTSLTNVIIGNSVISIGEYAFWYCIGLSSVTIPNSVTSIGNYAFHACSSLTSVTIPNSVISIGDDAFGYCSKINYIFYSGSQNEWKNISIGENNSPLTSTSAKIHYNSTGDHTWNSGAVTKQPTCVGTGIKTYTCTVCGDSYTTSIAATGHSFSSSSEYCQNGCGMKNPGYDVVSPTGSISSTNNVASSQTVTLSMSDNIGVAGYYWGTSSSYSSNTYTSTSSSTATKTVSSSGTYYLTVKDTSGNVSTTYSVTFYKTTLNANGGTVSPSYVITKSGNSFVRPAPTKTNYTFNGWATSSAATSGSTSSITPTSNATYYATWTHTHKYTSTVTKEATCTVNGVRTYTCSICNDSYTETITATGHSFSSSSEYCQNGCGTKNPGYDVTSPTGSISSTNNVASSQTVTLSMSDNIGVAGYYWGTNSNYSSNTYTSTSSSTATKTVSSSGTYYFTVKDTSGNVSTTYSVTFYKTTLNSNGGTVSPSYVITKSGNSFVRPTPTRTNYTFNGWATSSAANSGSTSSITPTSNATYYATWTHTHKYNSTVTKEATCTVNGVRTYTCSICNDSYTETITATGHSFSSSSEYCQNGCGTKNPGYDVVSPTGSISSTNNVATSQTVTLSMNDNIGIAGYYWGTSSNYSSNTYTSTSSTTVTKTVSSSGTYYLTVKDTSGNVSTAYSITFYKTTLNANGGTVSPEYVITKSGNSFTRPIPTKTNYIFNGWATSSSATSGSTLSITPTSNATYYATWTHTHKYNSTVTKAATCTENGVKTYTCSICNDSYTETITATGHSYSNDVISPTCTTQGYTKHTCSKCGYSYNDNYTQKADHNYTSRITQEATCTENGVKTYTCSVCNDSYTDVIEAPGHSYTHQVVPSTCIAQGYTKHTCSKCGYSYKDSYTQTTNHNYKNEVVSPTCTSQGYTRHTCTVCGDTYNDSFVGVLPHTYSSRVTQEATCTENGVKTYTCTVCNDSYTETITATGHNYGKVEVVKPTCTVKGYTKYTCTNAGCTDSYTTADTDMVDHVVTLVSSVAPTCTENGSNVYVCSNCAYQLEEVIPATGHNYGKVEVVPPTCSAKGYTKHTCSVCGDTYNDKYVNATAHSNRVTVLKATTTKNGSVVSKCSKCGKSTTQVIYYPKTISLSATSYTYDGKVKTPSVKVVGSNGKAISSSNYTVSYANGRKTVGRYSVKITFKGNYSGYVTRTFDIKPKASSITSISSPKKKAIAIKWKAVSSISGYEVQVSTSSNFSKSTKTYTAKSSSKNAQISKNIKGKTRYYVRIRTFKKVKYGGKYVTIYSSWSSAKSIKTKG